MPRITSTAATIPRRRDSTPVSAAASRSASIGSTFAARRAGIITEKNVITVPRRIPLTTGDAVILMP